MKLRPGKHPGQNAAIYISITQCFVLKNCVVHVYLWHWSLRKRKALNRNSWRWFENTRIVIIPELNFSLAHSLVKHWFNNSFNIHAAPTQPKCTWALLCRYWKATQSFIAYLYDFFRGPSDANSWSRPYRIQGRGTGAVWPCLPRHSQLPRRAGERRLPPRATGSCHAEVYPTADRGMLANSTICASLLLPGRRTMTADERVEERHDEEENHHSNEDDEEEDVVVDDEKMR